MFHITEEFINKIKSYINNKNEIYILHHDYREFEIKFEDLSKLNNNSEILFETFEDYNYNWYYKYKIKVFFFFFSFYFILFYI